MMSLIAILAFSFATFVAFVLFAIRLRGWVRNMRRDIYDIRDDVRIVKKATEGLSSAINSVSAECVNASCISSLGFRFPVFMGGWSIDTFLGRHLVQFLLENRPKCIVEFGSGSSTILIARILQILGEREVAHIAIDHEKRYLDITRDIATLNEVVDGVEFHCCPLTRYESLDKLWYGGVGDVIGARKIDLLIIDGPPADLQPMSRYPALPLLLPFMSEHCTIILDDATRVEEKAIARSWVHEHPEFSLMFTYEGHGLAILTR